MNASNTTARAGSVGQAFDGLPAAEVLRGLHSTPKTLPAKLFYDAAGAALFERITALPEYYLTRAELEILQQHARDIADIAGPHATVIDLGSGAGLKTRLLLDALPAPHAWVPVDVSGEQLEQVAETIGSEYPELEVRPVCADYTKLQRIPGITGAQHVLVFFPGSTIGNLHPSDAAAFLRRARAWLGPRGHIVLGFDRFKDARPLNAAYNDSAGVTAAFNLNLLVRLNREFGANFDLDHFRHHAFFNAAAKRVEMHLVSTTAQRVCIGGHEISFERGESITTEYSYKYDRALLHDLTQAAGLELERMWTDSRARFSVALLRPGSGPELHVTG